MKDGIIVEVTVVVEEEVVVCCSSAIGRYTVPFFITVPFCGKTDPGSVLGGMPSVFVGIRPYA